MNILFVLISSLPHVSNHGISLDLIHEFKRQGNDVYIVSAIERRDSRETFIACEDGCVILRVKIGNNKGASVVEKGLTTLMLPRRYIAAIKKYYSNIKFDLVLYQTPPITQERTVSYIKKRDNAKSYLLLKDIFPQNAVDIGLMSKNGIKGIIFKYFRAIEKRLYKVSDYIGCMSQANVDYVLNNNPELNPEKVEICPNSIEVIDKSIDAEMKGKVRSKYGIPIDKTVFIYGGNLGKPQDIPFVIECIRASKNMSELFYVIVGDGTEYRQIEEYYNSEEPSNLLLIKKLQKDEYDKLVAACDVGLVFLDCRFTIPNFPSRILGYMQAKIPIFACTDKSTDLGRIVCENGFGWWCESRNKDEFVKKAYEILSIDINDFGEKGYNYLSQYYSVDKAYSIITNRIE